ALPALSSPNSPSFRPRAGTRREAAPDRRGRIPLLDAGKGGAAGPRQSTGKTLRGRPCGGDRECGRPGGSDGNPSESGEEVLAGDPSAHGLRHRAPRPELSPPL